MLNNKEVAEKKLVKWFILSILFAFVIFLAVYRNSTCNTLRYRIKLLEKNLEKVQNEQKTLRSEEFKIINLENILKKTSNNLIELHPQNRIIIYCNRNE